MKNYTRHGVGPRTLSWIPALESLTMTQKGSQTRETHTTRPVDVGVTGESSPGGGE